MKLIEQIDAVCASHRIHDVLSLDNSKRSIICPLPAHIHAHNTPSFSIFNRGGKEYWKCHGSCNMEGDVVDLIGHMRVSGYDKHNPEKVREAMAIIDQRFQVSEAAPIAEKKGLRGDEWFSFLPIKEEVKAYALKRGILPETLIKFNIGQKGHYMAMPTFHEGILKGIKFRNTQGSGMRYFSLEGSRQGLFNYDQVAFLPRPVLILKGEIPVMLADQDGLTACAPTGGEGGWMTVWRTELALATKVVVGDNDAPGKILGEKRAAFFAAVLRFPPDPYKDWDEWRLADPIRCLKDTKRWLEEAGE
jgi:hypothetical protein